MKLGLRTWDDKDKLITVRVGEVNGFSVGSDGVLEIRFEADAIALYFRGGHWEVTSNPERMPEIERQGQALQHRECLKVERDGAHIDRKLADLERRVTVLERGPSRPATEEEIETFRRLLKVMVDATLGRV